MFTRPNNTIEAPALAEPTLAERFNVAQAVATQARSSFLVAALDLESAARDHDLVAVMAQDAIDDYSTLLDEAIKSAESNRAAAKAIRNLVEPDQLALF